MAICAKILVITAIRHLIYFFLEFYNFTSIVIACPTLNDNNLVAFNLINELIPLIGLPTKITLSLMP
jgi:hypothetical protein